MLQYVLGACLLKPRQVQHSTGCCHRAVAACSQPLSAEETTKLPCMASKVQIGGGGTEIAKLFFSQFLVPGNFEA
jgi:hypothetical protein